MYSMDNSTKIRWLLQDIDRELRRTDNDNFYDILTRIVISMETKYNLHDEEIIKQLELILESLKRY